MALAALTGWWPSLRDRLTGLRSSSSAQTAASSANHPGQHDSSHDHDHEHDHHAADSLELSEQARKNIGLQTGPVETSTFVRTMSVPGLVAERAGQTRVRVVAPLTGIVTRVHVIEGEAVPPGQPLFELRLTHEDLLNSQVEFLKLTEELDVVNREIERLKPIVDKGALPQKALLDRQYDQQKLRGAQRAQRQSLRLQDRKSTRLNSSHSSVSRMPSSA